MAEDNPPRQTRPASPRLLSFWLLLVMLLVAATAAGATPPSVKDLPPGARGITESWSDLLIVTPDSLAPTFRRLAWHKQLRRVAATVVTVEWISANIAGVDQADQIRHFVRIAHARAGARYLLLGGSVDLVPTRYVRSYLYPPDGATDIPADLYYGCLDGDWDADGDGDFGEPFRGESDPGDEADLLPEVAVGRAPVGTVAEADAYVEKVMAYERLLHGWMLGEALFLGDEFAGDGTAAAFCEQLAGILQTACPTVRTTRLYEDHDTFPGSLPLTASGALDALGRGRIGLVQHVGDGSYEHLGAGQDEILLEAISALANGPEFFVIDLNADDSAFVDGDCPLARFVLDADGGAVAGFGHSRAVMREAAEPYHLALYEALMSDRDVALGDALVAVLASRASNVREETEERWTSLTFVLLGDPTLSLRAPVLTSDKGGGGAAPAGLVGLGRHRSAPNPFNPTTNICFEVRGAPGLAAPASVVIYDVTGRALAEPLRDALSPGFYQTSWDGRDRGGRALASGVYFAVVRVGEESAVMKLTLAR